MSEKNLAYQFVEYEKYIADNPEGCTTFLSFAQWYPTYALSELKDSFNAGDKSALMEAIFVCATSNLPLAPWAAYAYDQAYSKIALAQFKSWDDVFGVPYPKGTQLNAIKKRNRLQIKVYDTVEAEVKSGRVVGESLFEDVGKKYAICKTLASEYYYDLKKRHLEFQEIMKNNGIT